jgi:DNA-binding response OmpR family regulator
VSSEDVGSTTSPARMLVIDDAPVYQELLRTLLGRAGYDVTVAATAEEGLAAFDAQVDAVVLDLSLPDLDGLEVCRRLRDRGHPLTLMLTSRDSELDKVLGLRTGADDYLTKPFSPPELLARLEALLRRRRSPAPSVASPTTLSTGDLVVDLDGREVGVAGRPVALTRTEFDLLAVLARHPKKVFSRENLLDEVWGDRWFSDRHVVDVHIANLRRKIDLAGQPSHITTVRGVGYRLAG